VQALLILLTTIAGGLAAFLLFMGTDELTARVRGRSTPAFDWFEGGAWAGRSTSARTAVRWIGTVLAGVAWLAIAALALGLLLAGVALGIRGLIS
jgi:hypothetical protein